MTQSHIPVVKRRASVYANGDFILVVANSGYRSSVLDSGAYQSQLSPSATDEEIGQSVRDALAASRFLDVQEAQVFMANSAVAERYRAWVEELVKKNSYRTKKQLFESMLLCHVEQIDGDILISPTVREQLEGWSGFPDDDPRDLRLPAGIGASRLGESVRQALAKCE